MFQKTSPLSLPFYFSNNSVKNWPIIIICGIQHPGKNLTPESYKLTHLTYDMLLHYLVRCENGFLNNILQLVRLNSWLFKTKIWNISTIFIVLKLWKMSLTSLHYSHCSKFTERKNHGVCICHYSMSSSTMCCWNAVHLWNRCCCNSGRMSLLWMLTVTQASKLP